VSAKTSGSDQRTVSAAACRMTAKRRKWVFAHRKATATGHIKLSVPVY